MGEVMAFIEWLQPAVKALELGQPLPDSPKFNGDLASWIQGLRNLEDRRRESEEVRISLESDMRDREAYVSRLTQQLQASMEEIKATQASSQQLQRELTACKEMLAKVSEVAAEVESYDGQLKSIASEVMSKGSQLDKLVESFRDVSTVLRTLAKTAAIS
jgi:chromosome segregation ATPase